MASVGLSTTALCVALCVSSALGGGGCDLWTFGKEEQSCVEACSDAGGECPSDAEGLVSSDAFNLVLPEMFPVGSQPCKLTQLGESPYDPSVTKGFCGWEADTTEPGGVTSHDFSCSAKPPSDTRRFCPCIGLPPLTQEECADLKLDNLKRANLEAYNAFMAGVTTAAPEAPEGLEKASAVPDLTVGTSGKDMYTLVNKANDRALYCADGDVGARIGQTGSVEQNFHVVLKVPRDDTTLAKYFLINVANGKRLYAEEGEDLQDGFGATDAESTNDNEYWFVLEMKGGGGDSSTDFVFMNAKSNRYLYANDGHLTENMGAVREPGDNHIRWQLRVQSRVPVDGATFRVFHSGDGVADTKSLCTASPAGDITCSSDNRPTDSSSFLLEMVDASVPSFALKNVAEDKYCSDTMSEIVCNADSITQLETFSLFEVADGGVALRGGRGNFCSEEPVFQCNTPDVTGRSGHFEMRCIKNCPLVNSMVQAPGAEPTRLYSEAPAHVLASSLPISGVLLFFGCACLFALGAVVRRWSKGQTVSHDTLTCEEGSTLLVE